MVRKDSPTVCTKSSGSCPAITAQRGKNKRTRLERDVLDITSGEEVIPEDIPSAKDIRNTEPFRTLQVVPTAPAKVKKARKKAGPRTPSIKKKILAELRAKKKSIAARKKAINKEYTQVKRDIKSISCRKKKTKLTRVSMQI